MYSKNLRNMSRFIVFFILISSGFFIKSRLVLADTKDFEVKDNVLLSYHGSNEFVKIPEEVNEIGIKAFSGNTQIREVVIPNSVNNIQWGAFENCTQLESVILPEQLGYLSNNVFAGCINLKNIELPNSLRRIGDSTFSGCSSLESIRIPDSVVHLGWYAFHYCNSLSNIVLPDKLDYVGFWAFEGTKWLDNYKEDTLIVNDLLIRYQGNNSKYIIPDHITKISDGAFYNKTSIEEVVLPDGIVYIGNGAFSGCSNLIKINIPEGVTTLGSSAFSECSQLVDIIIPTTVQEFGQDVFKNTLYQENYPDDFLIINNILLEYLGNKEIVTIPDNVSTINVKAFTDNHIINTIIIPDSVKQMRVVCIFRCSSLQKVIIPASVTCIDEEAISECGKNLEFFCVSGSVAEEYAKEFNISCSTVSLNKTSVLLYTGKTSNTTQLKITHNSDQMEWKSSNEAVAVVTNTGLVKAKKKGTANVKAVINGLTLTCKVTVEIPRLNKDAVAIKVGKTYSLQMLGYSQGVVWKSSEPKIASVNSNGKVTAKKKGKVKVTAEVDKKTYTCTITVR